VGGASSKTSTASAASVASSSTTTNTATPALPVASNLNNMDITEFTADQACQLYEGKIERKSEQELVLQQLGECLASIAKHVDDPLKSEECIYFPTDFAKGIQVMTSVSPLVLGGAGPGGIASGAHIERLHRRLVDTFETQLRDVFGFQVESQSRMIKVSWSPSTSDICTAATGASAQTGSSQLTTRPLTLDVTRIKNKATSRTKAILGESPDLEQLFKVVEVFGAEDALAKQIDARSGRRDELFATMRAEHLRVLREAATHHRNYVSMSPLSNHVGQGRLTSADKMILFERLVRDLEERNFTVSSITNAPTHSFTASFSRASGGPEEESKSAPGSSTAASIASIMAKQKRQAAEDQLKLYSRLIGELTNLLRAKPGGPAVASLEEQHQIKRIKEQSKTLYEEILAKMISG
jgi:hypothetical protein